MMRRGGPTLSALVPAVGLLALALGGMGVAAFLSPLPSHHHHHLVGGRAAAASAAVGQGGRQQQQHAFLASGPRRPSQQRLYAAVDTEEKKETAGAAAAVVVDEKAQAEMERLLEEGTDLLGLVDHLKAHRGGVRLTWAQVSWWVG